MGTGWYWFFGLLWAYILLIFWLIRSGKMVQWNMSLAFGFVLMIRTQRGKGLLDAMSKPKRFWNIFGDLGIAVALITMAGFTFLLLLTVLPSLDPDSGLEPAKASEILVIPGVNPFVPLWYGLIGLIVTLVVHEGGHGLLARANDLKVKSLGLLFAIVPVGAFVEPDEDEIREATKRKRLRVFCAGPMTNITVGLLLLIPMVAMINAAPVMEGAQLGSVEVDSPAYIGGIEPGDVIVAIDNHTLTRSSQLGAITNLYLPGQNATVHLHDGTSHTITFVSRWSTLKPEFQQEFQSWTSDVEAFCTVLYNVTTSDQWGTCAELADKDAMLGVGLFFGHAWHETIASPFGGGGRNFVALISLPIQEVRGQPILGSYLATFSETPFDQDVYWPLFNVLFWVFWLNVLVGTFNALPMLPLDGGHIFRDAVSGVVEKIRPSMEREKRDKIVGKMAGFISLGIFLIILISLLGPRLAPLWG